MNLYVGIEVARNQNIGTVLRCAIAFGAEYLVIVGSNKFSTHGAHGAQKHIKILHFFYWNECADFFSSSDICGIVNKSEHQFRSDPVHRIRIFNSTLFIVPLSTDLTLEQISICNRLVHVDFPKYHIDTKVHNVSILLLPFIYS